MKYGELNLGQVEAMVNKLGGMEGVRRFLAGELVVKEMECQLKVWKTIKLGTGLKTADDFRKFLEENGFRLSDLANEILGKAAFTVTTEETEVDLVKVTVAELGFKKGAGRNQVYERAKEFGLKLCPPEVGPQLRLQYQDQPNGEWVSIGMKPITDSVGDPFVFRVGYPSGGFWLGGDWGDTGRFWNPSDRWVFVRPRK